MTHLYLTLPFTLPGSISSTFSQSFKALSQSWSLISAWALLLYAATVGSTDILLQKSIDHAGPIIRKSEYRSNVLLESVNSIVTTLMLILIQSKWLGTSCNNRDDNPPTMFTIFRAPTAHPYRFKPNCQMISLEYQKS